MLFLNVLLFCLVGTPVLATAIPRGDIQIRSPGPRDGQLRAWASRLGRRTDTTPQPGWDSKWKKLKVGSPRIQGTWYLSPEKPRPGDNNQKWRDKVIKLDLTQWPPTIYDLSNKPGELLKATSEQFELRELAYGPWRHMPYREGFEPSDKLTFSIENGFQLLSSGHITPNPPPPISEQICSHLVMGPGRGTKSTGHVNYISDFWYGIESHNRKVIMKINDLRSFTFYELRDGAKEVKDMKVAKDHVKEHALGTWRRIPTKSQPQGDRNEELLVRMQNDELYFDLFQEYHSLEH